ncbi:MAG: EFR1 family ferrodoxin [Oscillospiraceae bacterium]|jgi:ferredoxin/flavodoxin|nr:EFR1 family ferrodoxin [Oscillospiraceae bacterium]
MNIQKITGIYFSPTGTTKSVIKHILSEFEAEREEIDLTPYESRNQSYSFNENELVIIGIPVYGGRVPITAEERIKLLSGNNTPIVLVATYGSIHYSNALFELGSIVAERGFTTIGAAIVVSEHNAVSGIAIGRPNAHDLSAVSSFIAHIQDKLTHSSSIESIVLKGTMPKIPRAKQPLWPHGDKKCTHCGVCNKLCPAQAIDDPRKKAGRACIHCLRCVKNCPQKARTYGKLLKVGAKLLLALNGSGREKQSEFFA